ncbi:MAG: hypothetical protein RSA97_09885, partial [Oscillospiraceae bacterium]
IFCDNSRYIHDKTPDAILYFDISLAFALEIIRVVLYNNTCRIKPNVFTIKHLRVLDLLRFGIFVRGIGSGMRDKI